MAQWCGLMVVFYLLVCLLNINFTVSLTASNECVKENSCRCRFSNGSVIDLHTIGNKENPRFSEEKSHANDDYYYYNPCYDFKINGGGPCEQGVAGCVKHNDTQYISLGNQDSSAFYVNEPSGEIILTYTSPDRKNQLNVTLKCTNDENPKLTIGEVTTSSDNKTVTPMKLYSKCACLDRCLGNQRDEGLSTGSILIILSVVGLAIYVFGGMVFLHFFRGANGIEMIPNYEFWTDLPFMIRDGILFTLNGCKPEASYDRI